MRGVERECWCDSSRLEPFSTDYLRCVSCGTLVSQGRVDVGIDLAGEPTGDSYGRNYWFSHQRDRLGLPDLDQRARLDLPERCLYWLRALLAHKLPPARTLELGCSHGAFVSLLRHAGFDAMGLELSPWVVDHAQQTFRIPMLQGPIEQRQLPTRCFDAIILNDVLEHLPRPLRTIHHCVPLLKPEGVLLIQTPSYPDPKTYEQLQQDDDAFLKMLLPEEHLYLFSQRALRRLLVSLGCRTVDFKPALFPYDMYAVASRDPVAASPRDAIVAALSDTPNGRIVLALLDLDDRLQHLSQSTQEQQSTIMKITQKLQELSADNEARFQTILQQQTTVAQQQSVIQDITRKLEELTADNEARFQTILQQQTTIAEQQGVIQDITRKLEELTADNEARLQVILQQQATIAGQNAALAQQQRRIDAVERNRFVRLLKYSKLLRP